MAACLQRVRIRILSMTTWFNRFLLALLAISLVAPLSNAAVVTVEMRGIQFVPKNLTINAGDTVTWVNRDSTLHDTVSGVNRVPAGIWRSALFGLGGSFSFTFTNAGTFPYYCTPHVFPPFNMSGAITVLPVNAPPSVAITNPPSGATFTVGATVLIEASATDDNGVVRVEFFANGNPVGTDLSEPFVAVVTNLAAGDYVLTAAAFDAQGLSATSAPVNISVREPLIAPVIIAQPQNKSVPTGSNATFSVVVSGTAPLSYQWQFSGAEIPGATSESLTLTNVQTAQAGSYFVVVSNVAGSTQSSPAILIVTNIVTNIFPTVALTAPANGSRFRAGTTIPVQAAADDENGTVARVEFFLNNDRVGVLTNSPYEIVLSNLVAGDYFLSARAEDDEGAATVSEAVMISVLEPPTIRIVQPADQETFLFGTNVLLVAEVLAPEIAATAVQFFEEAGNGLLPIGPLLTNVPYNFLWKPAVSGVHWLRAAVYDDFGGTSFSEPVSVVFDAGTELPTIVITDSPPDHSRLTAASVLIRGIASDDLFLDRVVYRVNGGPFSTATGTTNWSAIIDLVSGTNVLTFQSVDLAGNFSRSPATRTFIFRESPVTVRINPPGWGKVSPNLDGELLEHGKVYQMVARPASGFIFGGWSDGVSSNQPVLNFTMRPALGLTANFTTNPFPSLKGTYSGLIWDTNGVRPESSGIFKINLTARGAFSGKVTIQNKAYPMRGQLDYTGFIRFAILRRPMTNLALTLSFDMSGENSVTGSVESEWSSVLRGNRVVSIAELDPGLRGKLFQFDLAIDEEKVGDGNVKAASALKIRGRILDERFSQVLFPSASGESAFYFSWNRGGAVLLGWTAVQNDPDALLRGDLILGTANDFSARVSILPAR